MNTLTVSRDTYTDTQIDHAINEAIGACNHNVSNSDVLSYLIGNTYNQHAFAGMSSHAKGQLSTRISRKMAGYVVVNKNSKYTTWRVK